MAELTVQDIKTDDFGDFILNGKGGVELADSTQCTKQVVIFRLKTAFDDFEPNPDIGADLEGMVGEINNGETRRETETRIRLSLTRDGFLVDSDIFVKIVPTSSDTVVVVVLISGRIGFNLDEFSASFILDYLTGDIQMLDQ
jgi:hypothetical protein